MTCTILSAGKELHTICKNEHEPPLLTIRNRLFELIQSLCMEGFDSFYVNCNYGILLWAAEFIAQLKKCNLIELHIVIPYEEQTTNWPEEFRDRYFAVHAQADSVELAATQFCEDCYTKADRRMIGESDVLIICGKDDSLAAAAEYAESQGVRVGYCAIV